MNVKGEFYQSREKLFWNRFFFKKIMFFNLFRNMGKKLYFGKNFW